MNRQQVKTQSTGQRPMPAHIGRKRPNPHLLQMLQGGMLIIAGLIVLLGLILILLPMFRVQSIEVEGNSIHTTEEIIEASGIKVGQELFSVSRKEVNLGIWTNCKYVDEIAVVRSFNKVKIIVVERENVMVTSFGDKYFSFDTDFHVIEENPRKEHMAHFVRVELPPIESLCVGGTITFEDGERDMSYVQQLILAIREEGRLSEVTVIDFSKKYNVSYVLSNACRVQLGSVSDVSAKLEMAEQILSVKAWTQDTPAVVDVSNLKKPTFRALSVGEAV